MEDEKITQIGMHMLKVHAHVNKRYVYIRIPKTGSASMNMSLWNATPSAVLQRRRENVNVWFQAPTKKSVLGGWWDHCSAMFCSNLFGQEVWNNTFSFSVVRNPFARLHSFWKYDEADSQKDFKSWIMSGAQWSHHQPHHDYSYPDNHMLSQKNWISDQSGNICVNFVFRLEDIHEVGIPALKSKIGPDFKVSSYKMNQTSTSDEYKMKYDNEMIDFVNEKCREDLEAFQYNFDNIEKKGLYYWNGIQRQAQGL